MPLVCFCPLAIMIIAVLNKDVWISDQVPDFSYFKLMPRSELAESYGNSIFKFWGIIVVSIAASPFYSPTNSTQVFRFLPIFAYRFLLNKQKKNLFNHLFCIFLPAILKVWILICISLKISSNMWKRPFVSHLTLKSEASIFTLLARWELVRFCCGSHHDQKRFSKILLFRTRIEYPQGQGKEKEIT